jgi:hypothetical protein
MVGCGTQSKPAASVFKPALDMKQLMAWVIEPNADVVWASVGTVVTAEGEEEHAPQTDAEWNAVRNAAAAVAESGNLLMVEQRARDHGAWMTSAHSLIDSATQAMQAAAAKDKEALFTAGGDVYLACSACHAKYALTMPKR